MRVVIHTPEPTSSPALYVSALVGALADAGTELAVVCPADHDSREEFIRNPRVTVHTNTSRGIDTRLGKLGKIWRNGYFILSSCRTLVAATHRGDIVNFQYVMHLPFSALFFLCAWLRGCRIAFTAHDPLPHKWLLPKMLRWIERFALGWMYRISDVVLVHSQAGKRTILRNFVVSESKVAVIAHGPYKLNTALTKVPESHGLELLLFGALRENKGAHLAIEAIQRLYRSGVRARLTIAGRVLNRKEQEYWDRCRGLIDDCPEPIRLMEKFIPDEELPSLFAAHHCFLLPYGDFHSDSGVAFMALANGRPFLSTNAGGLGQMMEDSQAGVPIKSACVEDVENAIRKAIELGSEKLRAMGAAGEAWVMRECGWPKVASQMRAIFATMGRDDLRLPAGAFEAQAANTEELRAIE